MKINNIAGIALLLSFGLLLFSCKEDNPDKDAPEFDRKTMLTNLGNNIIIPNYQVLQATADTFYLSVTAFNATTDSNHLVAVQNAFKALYLAWQSCSVFEFGPGEEELLRSNFNIFPTDTVQINLNISSGNYNLGAASNIDAKGLPAIDYLLFGSGNSNQGILTRYIGDEYANNRKIYLAALSEEIKTKSNNVYQSWTASGGNYINTFVNNSGTDIGSALGELVNQLNYDFETIKNIKIGIPLGKKTLGTPLPDKTEAYFSNMSLKLAITHIQSIENIYLGRDKENNDGQGLDDYLNFLDAKHNGSTLSTAIKKQFSLASAKLEEIPKPLSVAVVDNPAIVEAAYTELQKLVVLLKTDMPSAMAILITYQDNDGD